MNIDYIEVYKVLRKKFEHKVQMMYADSEKLSVGFFLYDSFAFVFGVGDKFQKNGGYMVCGDKGIIDIFLGKALMPIKDEKDIEYNIKIIDEYCRLRLPDKFLAAYDEAYKNEPESSV